MQGTASGAKANQIFPRIWDTAPSDFTGLLNEIIGEPVD